MLRMMTIAVAMMCLLAGPAFAGGPAGEHKYGGVKKCRSCHKKEPIGNQIGSWEKTTHATAFQTLSSEQAKEWATEAGVADPTTDEACVKCHVTAYGVPAERLGMKFKIEDGVQCEACHGAGTKYRKKKIMIDRDLAVENGLVLQSAEVCTTCHNDESPAWDPGKYTLADGTTTGFDYDKAVAEIAHPVPEGYDPMAEDEAD